MRHVIWDWNGTLLDDLDVVVASVNSALASIEADPIDTATYRRHYTRPVVRFYEALLGRAVSADVMAGLDERFHAAYVEGHRSAELAADACEALALTRRRGVTQSVASMLWHDLLVTDVDRAGITGAMVAVEGHRGGAGDTKSAHLEAHLATLDTVVPGAEMVLIGDITDDADAASSVGIDCVLYSGGTQPRSALEATGYPVATTLLGALGLAGI